MKKHILLAALTALAAGSIHANAFNSAELNAHKSKSAFEEAAKILTPTYVDGAIVPSWKDNWFVNVQGGANAFLGSPLGCGDLFDRMKPTLQVGVGKWHTPGIGNRIVFQGFEWIGGDMNKQKVNHYHADLMVNLTPTIGIGGEDCRWDIIPFVGLGVIDNRTAKRSPFAINYGIQGRFRVAKGLHVTAEFSNATTSKSADGYGNARQLGDNLMSLTAGISWSFGRNVGFKKIVDAKPYMAQNEQLMALAYSQQKRNEQLKRANDNNANVIAELHKILEIEGLLNKYSKVFDGETSLNDGYPVNDYSGLNSLRQRLREAKAGNINKSDAKSKRHKKSSKKQGKDIGMTDNDALADSTSLGNNNGCKSGNICDDDDYSGDYGIENNANRKNNHGGTNTGLGGDNGFGDDKSLGDGAGRYDSDNDFDETSWNEYIAEILSDGECLGAPIYFFFQLGKTQLVDASQLANLDEIARITNKYGLVVEIEGAADAATGTEAINTNLGNDRAHYIADCLVERGVDPDKCSIVGLGGIADYTPQEANRNAIIRLFLP